MEHCIINTNLNKPAKAHEMAKIFQNDKRKISILVLHQHLDERTKPKRIFRKRLKTFC